MGFLEKIRNNELFRGSVILLILMNVGSFLNYLYQFVMARMLGPIDYGILAALASLSYIFAIPTTAIQTALTKNISKLNVKKDYNKMKGLFFYFLKRLFITAIILFLIFVLISIGLSFSLKINFWLLVLTGILIITSFIYPIATGSLLGLKKFSALGWNNVLMFGVKLILAIILVFAGFRVYGAILGAIFGVVIGFIFAIPFLKEIINSKKEYGDVRILGKDNTIIYISSMIFVFIFSIDVLLARLFFSEEVVGKYAVISMIGKMILFVTISVGNAMFPISSERHHAGIKTKSLIKKTSLIVFILCFLAILLIILFPESIIYILFGSQYVEIANLLIYIGIGFCFIAFLNIFMLYKISIDEFKGIHVGFLFLFFIVQIVLLTIFNSSIERFSLAFMGSTIVTFIGTWIFTRNWRSTRFPNPHHKKNDFGKWKR